MLPIGNDIPGTGARIGDPCAMFDAALAYCRDVSTNVRPLPRDGERLFVCDAGCAVDGGVQDVAHVGVMRVAAGAIGLRTHHDASLRGRPPETMLTPRYFAHRKHRYRDGCADWRSMRDV